MYTHKEILEEFLLFEKENDLLNWEINNVPVWELIRIKIFEKIQHSKSSNIKRNSDIEIKKILLGLKNFLKNSFKYPLFKGNVDVLVLNHPRRKKNNGIYEDIYTDPFLPSLKSNFLSVESFIDLQHLKPVATENLYYLDFLEYPSRLISFLPLNNKLPSGDETFILELSNKFENKWGPLNLNLRSEVIKTFKRHKYLSPKIEKLINRLNPQKIISVVSYKLVNQIFTEVAKKRKIPVMELQHGTVGKYHIAYNFGSEQKRKTFPDYFLAWGDYWVSKARMPIPKENIITAGFPYINSFKNLEGKPNKNQIVILSQLREDIANFALELAGNLPTYTIIFKAHPAEYSIASTRYRKLTTVKNIELLADDHKSLYSLFHESSYVVGVSSTALIEALAFCSNIFVLKLPGWEYFEDMEDCDNIHFINDTKDFNKIVTQNYQKVNNTSIDHYFKMISIKDYCSLIEK